MDLIYDVSDSGVSSFLRISEFETVVEGLKYLDEHYNLNFFHEGEQKDFYRLVGLVGLHALMWYLVDLGIVIDTYNKTLDITVLGDDVAEEYGKRKAELLFVMLRKLYDQKI